VIERPDSVSRVRPPTTMTAKVTAAQTKSHAATARLGTEPDLCEAII
jgi:hypothetical protein